MKPKLKEITIKKHLSYRNTRKSQGGSYSSSENQAEVTKTYEIEGPVDIEKLAEEVEKDVVAILRVGPAWMVEETKDSKTLEGGEK